MARFTLPRDVYHGKGCLEELKNLKGKKVQYQATLKDGKDRMQAYNIKIIE